MREQSAAETLASDLGGGDPFTEIVAGEVIATLGLLLVIFSLARTKRAASTPAAVGAYIGAAYFFTSSASFANPASLRKRSAFGTASASCTVAWAMMLFDSLSIVKMIIVNVLSR